MKPTDEQIKVFWEWCGFTTEESTFRKEERVSFVAPDKGNAWYLGVPDIDLNNLFKYAVPKVLEKIGKQGLIELVNKAVCEAVEAKLYGQEGIPDHLFWALWEVKEE